MVASSFFLCYYILDIVNRHVVAYISSGWPQRLTDMGAGYEKWSDTYL